MKVCPSLLGWIFVSLIMFAGCEEAPPSVDAVATVPDLGASIPQQVSTSSEDMSSIFSVQQSSTKSETQVADSSKAANQDGSLSTRRVTTPKPLPSQEDFVFHITERARDQIISAMAGDISRFLVIKKPVSSRSDEFELEIDFRHDASSQYLCVVNDIKVLVPVYCAASLHNATLDFINDRGELRFDIIEGK